MTAGVRRGGAEDDRAGGDEEYDQQRGHAAPQAARRVLPVQGRGIGRRRHGLSRSAQAASIMRDQGFGNVIDAGALSNASTTTGIDIVTE